MRLFFLKLFTSKKQWEEGKTQSSFSGCVFRVSIWYTTSTLIRARAPMVWGPSWNCSV